MWAICSLRDRKCECLRALWKDFQIKKKFVVSYKFEAWKNGNNFAWEVSCFAKKIGALNAQNEELYTLLTFTIIS